jgi:hypothetical protein
MPTAVGVDDDGSSWLKLRHGPVKDDGRLLENPDFDGGLYIKKKTFSTSPPNEWNR